MFFRKKEIIDYPERPKEKNLYPILHIVKSLQEYQKDPVTNTLIHVDLLLAQKGFLNKYKVPVIVKGNAKGLKNKGVLFISTRASISLDLENCLP